MLIDLLLLLYLFLFKTKFEPSESLSYRQSTNTYLPSFLMSSIPSSSPLHRLRTPRESLFDQPPSSLSVVTDPIGSSIRGSDQQSPRKCALAGLPHQHNPGSQADPGVFQSPGTPGQSCLRKRARKRSGSGFDSSIVLPPPNVSLVDVDTASPTPVDLSASVVSPSLSSARSKRVTFADEVPANPSNSTSPLPIHGQIMPSAVRSPPDLLPPMFSPRSHSSFAFVTQSPRLAPNAAIMTNPVAALSPIRDRSTILTNPTAPPPARNFDLSLSSRSGDVWRPSASGTPQRSGQKNWITLFGYPQEAAVDVIGMASEIGPIVQHRIDPEHNWMHISYRNAADAQRAIHSLSGRKLRRLGREFMMAAFPCTDPVPTQVNFY